MDEKPAHSFEKDRFESLDGLSNRVADWIDNMTPNKITLIGLVLSVGMLAAFLCGQIALGAVLFGLSAFTDAFDGMLARRQQEKMGEAERAAQAARPFLERRGMTDDGGMFDPAVDKFRYFAALVPLCFTRWADTDLNGWLVAIGGLFATLLTLGRFVVPKAKANLIGKRKAHAEIGLIAWLLLAPVAGWTALVANVLLVLADLGGAGSFAGQVFTWRKNRSNRKAAS